MSHVDITALRVTFDLNVDLRHIVRDYTNVFELIITLTSAKCTVAEVSLKVRAHPALINGCQF